MSLSLHHSRAYTTSTWCITDDVNLDHSAKVVMPGFSSGKLWFVLTFHTLFSFHSLKASHYIQPIPEEQGIKLHLLKQECLKILFEIFCKKDLSLIPNTFMYSIIYLNQCGLMDIYFIPWIINQYCYLFCCSKCPALVLRSSFWVNAWVFLTYSQSFLFLTILWKHNKWWHTQRRVIYKLNTLASSRNVICVGR